MALRIVHWRPSQRLRLFWRSGSMVVDVGGSEWIDRCIPGKRMMSFGPIIFGVFRTWCQASVCPLDEFLQCLHVTWRHGFFWVNQACKVEFARTQRHGLCSKPWCWMLLAIRRNKVSSSSFQVFCATCDCKIAFTCQVLRNFNFTSNTGQAKGFEHFPVAEFLSFLAARFYQNTQWKLSSRWRIGATEFLLHKQAIVVRLAFRTRFFLRCRFKYSHGRISPPPPMVNHGLSASTRKTVITHRQVFICCCLHRLMIRVRPWLGLVAKV